MNPRKTSLIAAGILGSALLAASPFALADHHKGDKHHGKPSMEEMCEHFRAGTGPFDREERQQKRAEHRADMAERLKLNDEQREIWAEIHEERQEKHEKSHARMQAKMEKRCDTLNQ